MPDGVMPSSWGDATDAAALFAVDPIGTGGVVLRSGAGPARDRWMEGLRTCLPASARVRRIPLHVPDARLIGGLDLAATLRAGRPVAERGLLADADDGVVVLAMAERIASSTAARIAAAIDAGEVALERDGFALRMPARFGVVALDEGEAAHERAPPALSDRLAFHIDLAGLALRDTDAAGHGADAILAARARLPGVRATTETIEALCAAALALGIVSIRAPWLALRAARAAAALAGRDHVSAADASLAARLVLSPRATALPEGDEAPEADDADAPAEESGDTPRGETESESVTSERPLDDVVLAAAQAAIPANVLATLRLAGSARLTAGRPGRAGLAQNASLRGRPVGARRGAPQNGARLDLIETLRAAAPWQRLRQRGSGRIEVRSDDFRVTRFKHRTRTTTIFVVDASGSAALHRLAETKGAIELLLAECYVRRDQVALIAFRGSAAELLLPPTRSLVRAKRSLAGLPGGGGTPLAAGIDAAASLTDAVRRRGDTPVVVLLTDGRANVARDGAPSRERAGAEALAAARAARAAGVAALLVDTSREPQAIARDLAAAMGAAYLPLPHADAAALARAVKRAT